ncbi:hypothetical protein PENSPDRAFT_746852 [Peniophora sp. CONT]|nr:hypothetical protein PENSPDRAFT_746852 [Peniophora sp. CONT]
MSVASRNPFALLDDEPSAPAAPAPAKKESAPAPAAPAKKSNAPRGGKYPSRGGGRPRDSAPADEPAEDGGRRKFDGEGRGRGRGGRGRGDRGGRGRGGARGERLDRHSASGKTDTEKKVSQGWGAEEGAAELKDEVTGAADATAEADAWGAPAAAEGEADPWASAAPVVEGTAPAEAGEAKNDDRRQRRERTPEEEDNTVSYEEYLAQKAAAAEAEKHALRPANDGADDWTSSVQELKKSEEDAFFVGKQKAAPKAKAKKDEKVFLEIDARFERPQRGGFGGRGRGETRGRGDGRGRGRGEGRGRGRGEARGGRGSAPRQAAPTFDDESAFPSLS